MALRVGDSFGGVQAPNQNPPRKWGAGSGDGLQGRSEAQLASELVRWLSTLRFGASGSGRWPGLSVRRAGTNGRKRRNREDLHVGQSHGRGGIASLCNTA